ncbi:MAG: hypothetical protein HKN23_17915 [Verrucomicrobiales bacterium]|nr:hypothetical protein [Verrucomicrobiales bacterium]
MNALSRRAFHRRVGVGMLSATVGATLARELGLTTASAAEKVSPAKLHFGPLEPLVALMEETPADKLLPIAVTKLKKGEESLHSLMRAAALANARQFGGGDYVGMHTLMAMKPAYLMAQQLPENRQPLAILKILHRNTSQIQSDNSDGQEMFGVEPVKDPTGTHSAMLNRAVEERNRRKAEEILAASAEASPEQAFNDLLQTVDEDLHVHNVVFAHRAWEALDLVGEQHALTMLRQSLRFRESCEGRKRQDKDAKRILLPKLIDEFGLMGFTPGNRQPSEGWVGELADTIFTGTPENSARAVASALKQGYDPKAIGQTITLAANQLVLRDVGRVRKNPNPDKEIGSTHGDSIGVHASDAANAWRKMAEAANPQNTIACLVLGAYQATYDRTGRGGKFLEWEPRPVAEQLASVKASDQKGLLSELDGVIREENQDMACAVTRKYGNLGFAEQPLLDILLKYAISEDGALHGEKYYLTTTTDFADTTKSRRWNHLVGLSRVTASEYGLKAQGYAESCDLLGIEA